MDAIASTGPSGYKAKGLGNFIEMLHFSLKITSANSCPLYKTAGVCYATAVLP